MDEKKPMSSIGIAESLFLLATALSYAGTMLAYILQEETYVVCGCFIIHCGLFLGYLFYLHNRYEREEQTDERFRKRFSAEMEVIDASISEMSDIKRNNSSLGDDLAASRRTINRLEKEKKILEKRLRAEKAKGRRKSDLLVPDIVDNKLELISLANQVVREKKQVCILAGVVARVESSEKTIEYMADKRMIRQIFVNIIDNAVKYMGKQGILNITLGRDGSEILLIFKNNGESLPATELPHIFELGFQGSNATQGSGLGLKQVKDIVDYYGGSITAKSEKGLTLIIRLPKDRLEAISKNNISKTQDNPATEAETGAGSESGFEAEKTEATISLQSSDTGTNTKISVAPDVLELVSRGKKQTINIDMVDEMLKAKKAIESKEQEVKL